MDVEKIIEIRRLTKIYGRGPKTVKALDGVDLTVSPGEMVAVAGPPASVNTTLLNIAGCLDAPTSGSVTIAGSNVTDPGEKELIRVRRREFGFIFQRFYFIPTLTVAENVALPLTFDNERNVKESEKDAAEWGALRFLMGDYRHDPVNEALRRVGLPGKGRERISKLTSGDKQKVAVARALVNNPRVILADEPTGRLEPAGRDEIFALFRKLADSGTAFVVATRDPDAAALCDRTIYLQNGKIVPKEESWLSR